MAEYSFQLMDEVFHKSHGYGRITHWFPNNGIAWVNFGNYQQHFVKHELKHLKPVKRGGEYEKTMVATLPSKIVYLPNQ